MVQLLPSEDFTILIGDASSFSPVPTARIILFTTFEALFVASAKPIPFTPNGLFKLGSVEDAISQSVTLLGEEEKIILGLTALGVNIVFGCPTTIHLLIELTHSTPLPLIRRLFAFLAGFDVTDFVQLTPSIEYAITFPLGSVEFPPTANHVSVVLNFTPATCDLKIVFPLSDGFQVTPSSLHAKIA